MRSVLLWFSAVIASGVCAGFLAAACKRALPQLSEKRKRWLPLATTWIIWILAGVIAQYGFRRSAWGWAGSWSNNIVVAYAIWQLIAYFISDAICRSFRVSPGPA